MNRQSRSRLRRLHRLICSFPDPVSFQRRDCCNLTSQTLGQLLYMNLIPGLPDCVHHIDRYNDRNTQLHKLRGQIQVSLQIRPVHDIQDRIRTFRDQIIPGNHLFQCIRRQGVDSRQISNRDLLIVFQPSFFFLYRNSRPISNELIRTGKCVE